MDNGVRLIDYFSLHFYPQGDFITFSDANGNTTDTQARRLRSLKELYDPNWVSESWIGQSGYPIKIDLIHRMRAWVDGNYPGTKLAIGEYNFGDVGVSSALAQAEALAIFAREGVDLAMRWLGPAFDTLMEDAFSLYMNYDTAGHKVDGEAVRATSSSVDDVGGYVVRGTTASGFPNRLYVLLFNKATITESTMVNIAGVTIQAPNLPLYRFSSSRLAPAGTAAHGAGGFTLSLPARSATLAIVDLVPPAAPTAGSNSPICVGQGLNLTATTVAGATYSWTGPNGFTSTSQNPVVPAVTAAMAGIYSVQAIVGSFPSAPATVNVVVNADGAAPVVMAPASATATQTICQ